MILLDGLATSKKIKSEIAIAVQGLASSGRRVPHLAAVLIGDDGASLTYVSSKVKACEEVGFRSTLIRRDSTIEELSLIHI